MRNQTEPILSKTPHPPLVSVAKLCDRDCIIIFVKNMAYIIKSEKMISKAPRDRVTKLWTTDLTKPNEYK